MACPRYPVKQLKILILLVFLTRPCGQASVVAWLVYVISAWHCCVDTKTVIARSEATWQSRKRLKKF
ncbi:hypothetical protein PQ676_05845, partial [Rickettsia felis]|nr:hypothetical protein [Rickettsia felis]